MWIKTGYGSFVNLDKLVSLSANGTSNVWSIIGFFENNTSVVLFSELPSEKQANQLIEKILGKNLNEYDA